MREEKSLDRAVEAFHKYLPFDELGNYHCSTYEFLSFLFFLFSFYSLFEKLNFHFFSFSKQKRFNHRAPFSKVWGPMHRKLLSIPSSKNSAKTRQSKTTLALSPPTFKASSSSSIQMSSQNLSWPDFGIGGEKEKKTVSPRVCYLLRGLRWI